MPRDSRLPRPPVRLRTALFAATLLLATATLLSGGPNRYGHSDRVERHMLPAVSTGPMDPAWSPDGRWIAFAMRGDVWKVPAAGGAAVQLTEGPAYHFEPAWSPDGSRLALSYDEGDANLDVGIVDADGGAVRRVTTHAGVDVQPVWGGDGQTLYFTSDRGARGFGVYRVRPGASGPSSASAASAASNASGASGASNASGEAGDAAVLVTSGLQPAVSPDGTRLLYVDRVPGRMGSGGIWGMRLPGVTGTPGGGGSSASGAAWGEPTLVHYEEAEYRTMPAWHPNGEDFFYVTDEGGSNDVAILPAEGGNPVVLTPDTMHENAPVPSPDGTRLAFVSNHDGPTTLYTADIHGGPRSAWREVEITEWRSRAPTGLLRLRVLGPDGAPVPARVHLEASDGRGYAPDAADGGFHRVISVTETHYFHTDGADAVTVPAGPVEVEALRGFEYRPASTTVEVPAGGEAAAEIRLERMVDMPARGWWSGDTHLHDLHQGRFGLDHAAFFGQLVAEDIHVTNALIHMDGTKLMGRWGDLTGEPHPLSTDTHILQYGQEYRGALGHVGMNGIDAWILPLIAGAGATAYDEPTLELKYFDRAREQGGIAGFMHPFLNPVEEPGDAAGSLIPLDVALGRGDFYDVVSVYSDEKASSDLYDRLLNAGFRLAATGGSDNFSDVWRDPPPGAARSYVQVDGTLTHDGWMDGVRAMRTFGTTGPLLFLEVEGRGPGEEIELAPGGGETVRVRAEVRSIARVDSLEVLVNGRVAAAVAPEDGYGGVFEGEVAVPDGGWVAARAWGPPSRYVGDSYAFARTSPVWVVREGREWRSTEDARFLADAVRALWARVQDADWSDEERRAFRGAVDEAVAVYEGVAREVEAR